MTEFEKLNVEEALEATFEMGYHQGRLQAFARQQCDVARPNRNDEEKQRRETKLAMAKAIAQAVSGLAILVEETGGIR